MQDNEITRAALLKSKAKLIADRNERFAIIEEELEFLKEDVSDKLTYLSKKINDVLDAK